MGETPPDFDRLVLVLCEGTVKIGFDLRAISGPRQRKPLWIKQLRDSKLGSIKPIYRV
jgi:hypothetical protein